MPSTLTRSYSGEGSPVKSKYAARWMTLAIRAPYPAAQSALERFLLSQGRRKYLKPLYAALAETPEGLERAREIYARAKPLYHGIARGTIEEVLKL